MDTYEVRLYNTAGVLLSVFDSWGSLNVDRRLNDFSTHTFSFPSSDSRSLNFQKDYFLQIRRKNQYLDWYTEYIGFHRTRRVQITSTGLEVFTSYGRSFEDLLRRRVLAFPEPYTKTGPADDVMKAFVRDNTTNAIGRIVDGTINNFSVSPDLSLGAVWEGERATRNLLDTIIDVSKATDVDFYVDWVPPSSFLFRTVFPRNSNIGQVFSVDYGNLANIDYTNSATEEFNSILLGLTNKQSPAVNDSPWNKAETIIDPGGNTTPAELDTLADEELAKVAARENVSLDILQTPSSQYGRDYFLGDLVRVRMGSEFFDKIIMGVSITESGDRHSLDFTFGEPLGNPVVTAFRNLTRRISRLEA